MFLSFESAQVLEASLRSPQKTRLNAFPCTHNNTIVSGLRFVVFGRSFLRKIQTRMNEYALVLFVFRDGAEEVSEICLLALSIRKGSFSAVGNDYRSNVFRKTQDRFHRI